MALRHNEDPTPTLPEDGKEERSIGAGARRRLAGFSRTLRDNGFRVGLTETRDALAILSSPAAVRPSLLKPALRALFCATRSDWERFDEIFDAYWRGRGMRRVRTLSGTPTESRTSLRQLTEAGEQSQPTGLPDHPEYRSWSMADHRPAAHHSPQRLPWRHAGRSRLATTQDQAAAARHTARRLRIHEPLHRIFRAFPARRRRCLPRG